MVDILATPFLWVVATIALYAVAYWGYGKWIDRNVWRSDAKKATPAHMYMDGVEYFPVSRYVLWGYQFKSVAALGPILGPFIGVTFGWLPALIWIMGGNFCIGWLQDYGSSRADEPLGFRSLLSRHHLRHIHRPHCNVLELVQGHDVRPDDRDSPHW